MTKQDKIQQKVNCEFCKFKESAAFNFENYRWQTFQSLQRSVSKVTSLDYLLMDREDRIL